MVHDAGVPCTAATACRVAVLWGAAGTPWPLDREADDEARRISQEVENSFPGILEDGRYGLWLTSDTLAEQYVVECQRRGWSVRVVHCRSGEATVTYGGSTCRFIGWDYVSPVLNYSFVHDEVVAPGAPLTALSSLLNEYGLFATRKSMDQYLRARQGEQGLEEIESAQVVAVYHCAGPVSV